MPAEWSIRTHIEAGSTTRRIDWAIAQLVGRQWEVFAAWQLDWVSHCAIQRRLDRRQIRLVHLGVYTTVHGDLPREGRYMAAVLAGGPGAVLSHRSAATHHGMMRWSGEIEVTAPAKHSRPRIRFHRCRLAPDEVTTVQGIPVTTAARTMLDIALSLNRESLEHVLQEVDTRQLYDPTGLQELIERHRGKRGLALLRTCSADEDVLRSELERRFRRLVRAERLDDKERPVWNATIPLDGDFLEVDCLWPKARVVVELDSRRHHATTAAFERDRQRDRHLLIAAFLPFRVTSRMLRLERAGLAADLRRAISAPGARPQP